MTEPCTQVGPCAPVAGSHAVMLLANLNRQREVAQFCDCVVRQRQNPGHLHSAHRSATWTLTTRYWCSNKKKWESYNDLASRIEQLFPPPGVSWQRPVRCWHLSCPRLVPWWN